MRTILIFAFAVLALAGPAFAGGSCSALIKAGNAHAAVGKNEIAIAQYTRAIARCPRGALARFQRARTFFALGDFASAKKDFGYAVKAWPKNQVARKGLAWSLLQTGEAKSAVRHAEVAVAMRPNDIRAADTLAVAYTAVGKNKMAGEIFESLENFSAAIVSYRAAWDGRWGTKPFWSLNRLQALPMYYWFDRA